MSETRGPYYFPPEEYPITLEALHPQTRAVVWSTRLEKPPAGEVAKVQIPALSKQLGHPVAMRIRLATGEVREKEPPAE